MFGIGKIWVYAIAIGALVAAVALGLTGVYNAGYEARDAKAAAEAVEAQRFATQTTSALKNELDLLRSKSNEERKHAKAEIDSLRVRIHDGALRLRVTGAPAAGVDRSAALATAEARTKPDQATGASTVAGGQLPAVTLELDPALSLELLSITDDGDQAIHDLNECVDSYETLRKKLNGLTKRTD